MIATAETPLHCDNVDTDGLAYARPDLLDKLEAAPRFDSTTHPADEARLYQAWLDRSYATWLEIIGYAPGEPLPDRHAVVPAEVIDAATWAREYARYEPGIPTTRFRMVGAAELKEQTTLDLDALPTAPVPLRLVFRNR